MEDPVDVLGDRLRGDVGVGQVALDDFGAVGEPLALAVREVVDRDDLVVVDQSGTEVRADEARPAGDDQSLAGEIHTRTSSTADMCVPVTRRAQT